MTRAAVGDTLELSLVSDPWEIAVAATRFGAFWTGHCLQLDIAFEVNLAVD